MSVSFLNSPTISAFKNEASSLCKEISATIISQYQNEDKKSLIWRVAAFALAGLALQIPLSTFLVVGYTFSWMDASKTATSSLKEGQSHLRILGLVLMIKTLSIILLGSQVGMVKLGWYALVSLGTFHVSKDMSAILAQREWATRR